MQITLKRAVFLAAITASVALMVVYVTSPWAERESCYDFGGVWKDGQCVGDRHSN
jgi:hypothetical protein